ncbi:hypothetical protein PEDI_44010 [Persicobacter diffluens]|uniref:Uncharacterized protein n=1 Tax=Persicobacter diffluens TaxID=981 RepID=A0AAN5ALZ8_9BACT|nr:hypothetical protein PEDI_44010 [Persicobacter diffluens]
MLKYSFSCKEGKMKEFFLFQVFTNEADVLKIASLQKFEFLRIHQSELQCTANKTIVVKTRFNEE